MNGSPLNNSGSDRKLRADEGNAGNKTLWDELGIHAPSYADESTAPPVDHALLRAYVRDDLTLEARREVHRLIDTKRDWAAGHAAALQERLRAPDFLETFDAEVRRLEGDVDE